MPDTPGLGAEIAGIILAGGASRRMGGGDKSLVSLAGRPLLAHVIDRLGPQVGSLALNANGDPLRFASFGLPVVPDAGTYLAGPLAGILAGLRWAAANAPGARWIATVPADTPFVPRDVVARLAAGIGDAPVAIARSRGEIQPVVGLFALTLRDDLATWLAATSDRSARTWVARHAAVAVDFPDDADGKDPFFNVNTPDDLAQAEARARTSASAPVIHIVFNMSAAGILRQALAQARPSEPAIGLPDDLSSGPINTITAETRETWLGDGLGYFDPENRYGADLEAFWEKASRSGTSAVVWVNRRSAQEYAGFLEFVWRMGDRSYDVVDMTDVVFRYRTGVSAPAQGFGQINAEQIVEAGLLDLANPLTQAQRSSFQQEWARLRQENAAIRIVTPEGLRSAPITQFDDLLQSFVPDDWVSGARVLGNALAAQSDGPYHQASDLLLFSRLQALIDAGVVEGRGDLTTIRGTFVRLSPPAG